MLLDYLATEFAEVVLNCHLSSPEGGIVNDGVDTNLCSLPYVGVEEAARGVATIGRGALLAKVDVKSAYCNIPIHTLMITGCCECNGMGHCISIRRCHLVYNQPPSFSQP